LNVFLLWEEPVRQFFRESLFGVVCVADGHIENSSREAIVLRVGVRLDHDGHPFLKSIGRERGDRGHLVDFFLYQMVLAFHIAVDLRQGRVGEFSENCWTC
jgi:hypothetical protein